MAVRYSVIIPSYNRVQQLLLTLVALDRADYPKDLYEIIVVDDGSTDGTKELVEGFQTSVSMRYLANETQRGRSAARNVGIGQAQGLYVVFCDADFIVVPDFFHILDQNHRAHPRSVISCIPNSWDDAFTHIHPGFSEAEKQRCRDVLARSGLWRDEYDTVGHIVPLLAPDDLVHRTDRLSLLRTSDKMTPEIREQFARSDVAPWLKMITRCASVGRSYLLRVGGFNEEFVIYGLEDWDLGYRLHRRKIRFHSANQELGCHQEHPNLYRGDTTNHDNMKIMFKQYGFGDPELNLFAVLPAWSDVVTYKQTLRSIRSGMRSKSGRSAALLIRRALRASARHWTGRSSTAAYNRSMRAIRLRWRALKRKGPTAQTLKTILDKSNEVVNR